VTHVLLSVRVTFSSSAEFFLEVLLNGGYEVKTTFIHPISMKRVHYKGIHMHSLYFGIEEARTVG
jgi:hypothetical protein